MRYVESLHNLFLL